MTGRGDSRAHRPGLIATCHSGPLCLWCPGPFEARPSCPEPGAAQGHRAGPTSLQTLARGQPGLSLGTESSADTSSSLPSFRLVPSAVDAASRPGLSPGPLPCGPLLRGRRQGPSEPPPCQLWPTAELVLLSSSHLFCQCRVCPSVCPGMIWKRGLGGDRPPDLADRETQGKRQPRGHRAIHRGRSCRISQFQKPRDTFCLVVFWGFFWLIYLPFPCNCRLLSFVFVSLRTQRRDLTHS